MIDGAKVFSATTPPERELLGERLTHWLRDNPGVMVVEHRVVQSSTDRAHCLSIVVFFREARTAD